MAVSPNSLARRCSEDQIRRLVPGGCPAVVIPLVSETVQDVTLVGHVALGVRPCVDLVGVRTKLMLNATCQQLRRSTATLRSVAAEPMSTGLAGV
jgi:hypothetical protein